MSEVGDEQERYLQIRCFCGPASTVFPRRHPLLRAISRCFPDARALPRPAAGPGLRREQRIHGHQDAGTTAPPPTPSRSPRPLVPPLTSRGRAVACASKAAQTGRTRPADPVGVPSVWLRG